MDVLKDKKTQQFNYTCRMTPRSYYYHTVDDKYIYGVGYNMSKKLPYDVYVTKQSDLDYPLYKLLDSLANYYYGDPTLYWVIADFNDILDVFKNLESIASVKIPKLSAIKWGEMR